MENGEIAVAQNYLQEAAKLIKVMIGDVFEEAKEFCEKTDEEDEYDFSVLDLSKLLNIVVYNAGALINCFVNNEPEAVKNVLQKKLTTSINAVTSRASSILLN